MNKIGSIQKFLSIAITISIIALLVFVVPANAFDLQLSAPSNPNPQAGELVSFTATANIDAGEQVPLNGMQLYINSQLCKFQLDGTPIEGCDDITITVLENTLNFQEGNNTFEYKNDTYDYGYGYGYGYGFPTKIKYNITINTTGYNPGKYDVTFKTKIDSDIFKSSKSSFTIQSDAIRINAGGNEYVDGNGKVWIKDDYYNTGKASTISNAISGTTDDYLFQTERFDFPGNPELEYIIPVANGKYEVNLYFAEVWSGAFANNKRVFDVYIENSLVLDNLDIYNTVGKNTPLKKTFTVEITDGEVDIDFKHVIQNPKISAIEIIKKEEQELPTLRINAGGNEYLDSNGDTWAKDHSYNTGKASTIGNAISGTTDDYLFQTERFDFPESPELSYDISVPNGEYDVSLYFAEVWSPAFANNKRVFDIYIEGALKEDNFDIYKEVGANKALKKIYKIQVTDGKVDIDFKHVIQNPKISAIEIKPSEEEPPEPFELRINAGGNEYLDSNSNTWDADSFYNTGKASTISNAISGTTDDYLFQTERFDFPSNPELSYDITVPNGEYDINLYFAEVWSPAFANNKRVFDVYVEGALELDNLDIYKEVGANKMLKKTFTIHVTDGKVDIDFKHVIQNPKISAIEIIEK